MGVKLPNLLILVTVTFFSLFTSCSTEEEESIVLTENLLYLSGERVRLSGRIYSNNGNPISDHGFEISLNEQFSNPILIQNGPKNSLGAFIGEASQLVPQNQYFYRAFAVIDGLMVYGAIKQFQTLEIFLKSYEPHFAYSGTELTITGSNFPADIQVFFGEKEAEILNIDLEAIITVKVPEISTGPSINIKIKSGDIELIFEDPFEYIYGAWSQLNSLPASARFANPISISKENKFLIGLGNSSPTGINDKIFEYDVSSGSWMEIPFEGAATTGSFFTDEGYFGSGAIGFISELSGDIPVPGYELWKYNNSTFQYLGETPFSTYKAASFLHNSFLYVLGGLKIDDVSDYSRNSYRYSTLTSTWEVLDNIPIKVSQDFPHFGYNNMQYFITEDAEIWSYDSEIDDWKKIGNAPMDIKGKGIVEVINDKAYIGLFSFNTDIWEYDIIKNTWKVKTGIQDNSSKNNGGSYVFDSKVRVIRLNVNASDAEWIQTWEFDPAEF